MSICKTYNLECRSSQCYRCWKYGHKHTNCPITLARPICASPREQKGCPQRGQYICNACGGCHAAFSKEFKLSKEDDKRIKEKLLATPWRLQAPARTSLRVPKANPETVALGEQDPDTRTQQSTRVHRRGGRRQEQVRMRTQAK